MTTCKFCHRPSDNPVCHRAECQERYVAEFVPPPLDKWAGRRGESKPAWSYREPAWFKDHKGPKVPKRTGRPPSGKTEQEKAEQRRTYQREYERKRRLADPEFVERRRLHCLAFHERKRAKKLAEKENGALAVKATTGDNVSEADRGANPDRLLTVTTTRRASAATGTTTVPDSVEQSTRARIGTI